MKKPTATSVPVIYVLLNIDTLTGVLSGIYAYHVQTHSNNIVWYALGSPLA